MVVVVLCVCLGGSADRLLGRGYFVSLCGPCLPELMPYRKRPTMIISKDIVLLLRIISTAPAIATKLFSRRQRFLQGYGVDNH